MSPAPPAFHVLAKPVGAICNLACRYCFYLEKERLYPGSNFQMSEALLGEFLRQYIEGQQVLRVTIAWQGGEPTLMGLDFFRRSVELAERYKKPGMQVSHTIQTNGTLLDDDWCAFFREHNFLVGISIDGPKEVHDAYRVDRRGRGSFDRVMAGLRCLQEHKVEYNILCTVHAANGDHPLETYRFFRDEARAQYLQFIPIVEREDGPTVTDRSVDPVQWGRFLCTIFDEWVRRDVGEVFVQHFDTALAAWTGHPAGLCTFAPTCGAAVALEHNGDLYSCDHFVEPAYLLGNITKTPLAVLVGSENQQRFGREKQDGLPRCCRECPALFACRGGCPKNRFITTPDAEPGLNYLCEGYRIFFSHIDRPMRLMADLLRRGRTADGVMKVLAGEERARVGRNDPCPCGSGVKYKKCHGRRDG
ncbi:anaerobic sulfatase maturase [Methanofollis formosanus]|uniref:Anaerobic sulfatase maturase n=1 Tax=Methanofollis formosanus TaxID=299308 RepID=A0A8G1A0S5_9EURY|nr:anaerobic sulfatase maturase [Methanofollis formosanus]QYZ77982.1 anaerobic sulfatase maturase [Methanofollis formosanus]